MGKQNARLGGIFWTFHGDGSDMGIFLNPHHGIEGKITVVVFEVIPVRMLKFNSHSKFILYSTRRPRREVVT
jgi:hypothetical protein